MIPTTIRPRPIIAAVMVAVLALLTVAAEAVPTSAAARQLTRAQDVTRPMDGNYQSVIQSDETVLTIYCSVGSANPDNRTLGVVASDLGIGFPTLVYTLYTLDPDVPVAAQPAPTSDRFEQFFTGPYSRLRVDAEYPDGRQFVAESLCIPSPPAPTATSTPAPSATATNTPRPTRTPTATNTPGPSPTPTATRTPRPTRTPTMTNTPGPSPTPRPTRTPTATPTASPTPIAPDNEIEISCAVTTSPSFRIVSVRAMNIGMGFPTLTYTLFTLDPSVPLPPAEQPAPTDDTYTRSFAGPYSRLQVSALYPDGTSAFADALCQPLPSAVPTETATSTPVTGATATPTATTPPVGGVTGTAVPSETPTEEEIVGGVVELPGTGSAQGRSSSRTMEALVILMALCIGVAGLLGRQRRQMR